MKNFEEQAIKQPQRFPNQRRMVKKIAAFLMCVCMLLSSVQLPLRAQDPLDALADKIEEIEAVFDTLNEDKYTASSWSALEKALREANALLIDKTANAEDFKNAKTTLEQAYKRLRTQAETEEERAKAKAVEALNKEIKKTKTAISELQEADYTAETWSFLRTVLLQSEEIVQDAAAKSEDILLTKEALSKALKNLKVKADVEDETTKAEAVTALKNEIARAKTALTGLNSTLYTDDSWAAVEDAITEAENLLKDEEATTAEYIVQKADITTALDELVTVEEETEEQQRQEALKNLQASIADAKELLAGETADAYTQESWNALQTALTNAQNVAANAAASLAQLSAAADTLDTAIAELESEDILVSQITFTEKNLKLAAGMRVYLQATVLPDNAHDKDLEWSSSKTAYATVNANGVVVTKKAGAGKTVTITARAADGSGVKASVKIKILKGAVSKITLSAPKSVKAGKKVKVKTSIKTTGTGANKKLKWTSSNDAWATVKNGVVKTTRAGKGKKIVITAISTDGTNKKAKVRIKMK